MRLLMLLRRALIQELVGRRDEPRFPAGCCGEGAVNMLLRGFGNRRTGVYSIMNIA